MNESQTNVETVSWDVAWQELRTLLPNATFFTPGSLLTAAENYGMRVDLQNARQIASAENDMSILCKLLAGVMPDEAVIVVTDRSFLNEGTPFIVRLSHCEAFANAYQQSTGESVISGADVVFVCPQSKFLVLYHHEGTVAVVR